MNVFCGYFNKYDKINNENLIEKMCLHTGNIKIQNTYIDNNFIISSASNDTKESMYFAKNFKQNEYIITFNGELYNYTDLKNFLHSKNYNFSSDNVAELVLISYIHFKEKCVDFFNGIFSFAIYDKNKQNLFLARDRLGVKPLFFTQTANEFIFASNLNSILKHPKTAAILDKTGIMELIGLGPAHTPGKTYFKNIYELKAGYIADFSNNILTEKKYWDLITKECTDSEEEAISQIQYLVKDATSKQIKRCTPICCMLSGGLDSSILSKLAKDAISNLTTFSIDYIDNDTNFIANDYQSSKDSDYVKIMQNYLKTNHKNISLNNSYLFDNLNNSMFSRNMPGMGDIDSSMYMFCKKIKESGFNYCLSGECSDEIFAGYPWYYKEHLINHEGFPWSLSENLRNNILKPGILNSNELNEYILNAKSNTLKNVEHLEKNDDYEVRFRNTNYITIKWFMNTLIERTERLSSANSLNVRIPFADHRIFEYVYNLPARMKLGISKNGEPIEKYLLRRAFEKELPSDVVYRKKSPFPKTYDPKYLNLVETEIYKILHNKDLKIHKILNVEFLKSILFIHGENLTQNWFGQLMTYPQTLAYIIQISNWLEYYNIEIDV